MRLHRFAVLFALFALVAGLAAAACGGDDDSSTPTASSSTVPGSSAAAATSTPIPAGTPAAKGTLRLGYFANVTHAPALIEVADGSLQKELGGNVKLETKVFNAGPDEIQAMFAGAIDAAYVGPNPAINGFQQSNGQALRIVSGAASAGALLIVRPAANISKPEDLANKKVATPQLGNTQDVALRAYLKNHGLKPKEDGGNVTVLPTANADTLTLFQKGDIDAAWVPEPWASRLVLEAGGKVFLDERSLWPNGDFVTTQLVVSTDYLKNHPDVVAALIRANVKAVQFIGQNAEQAKTIVNKAITDITGKGLSKEVIDASWNNLRFTYDPIASSLAKAANDAYDVGLLKDKPNLKGIYSLDILNNVLAQQKLAPVKDT